MGERIASLVSVVIPVRNQADMLFRSLHCLRKSRWTDYETIVVDDASNDLSGEVAEAFGCRVLRLHERGGPARARNLGARVAKGELLVFLDADVCLQPDTLTQLLAPLQDESIDAVFGSYDADPAASNLVSQFRNLLHHYTHQTGHEEAGSFWAGCGAIRRRAFFNVGGYCERFADPSVEDIELGLRLRRASHRIVIERRAMATHLKRWSLAGMCACDLWARGVPWMLLIAREKRMPNDLNIRHSQRWSVALMLLLIGMLALTALNAPWILAIPLLLLASTLVVDASGPMTQLILSVVAPITVAFVGMRAFEQQPVAGAIAMASVTGILWANWGFYCFLRQARGLTFAMNAFPLHLLYFAICGVSVAVAMTILAWQGLLPRIAAPTGLPRIPSAAGPIGPTDETGIVGE